jgi:hypothetical protein
LYGKRDPESWQLIAKLYKSRLEIHVPFLSESTVCQVMPFGFRFNNRTASELTLKYSDLQTTSKFAEYQKLIKTHSKMINQLFSRQQCLGTVYQRLKALEKDSNSSL